MPVLLGMQPAAVAGQKRSAQQGVFQHNRRHNRRRRVGGIAILHAVRQNPEPGILTEAGLFQPGQATVYKSSILHIRKARQGVFCVQPRHGQG